jgi:small subunit ribosomal protein S35
VSRSSLPYLCFYLLLNRLTIIEISYVIERAKAFPFQPPNPTTHYLRLTSFHNTSEPNDPLSAKKVIRVPISRLPLPSPDAVKRFKLIAGPRWVPPPGVLPDGTLPDSVKKDLGEDEKEGYFVMSEEGWKEGRMNRKWLSDVLDKLVDEANVSRIRRFEP